MSVIKQLYHSLRQDVACRSSCNQCMPTTVSTRASNVCLCHLCTQALLSGSTSPRHNSSMGPSQSMSGAASATFAHAAIQQGDKTASASAAALVPPWKRRPVGDPEGRRARVTTAVAEPGAIPSLSSRAKLGLAKGPASSQLGSPPQKGSAVAPLTGWEAFCRSNLSTTAASAVLRATAR